MEEERASVQGTRTATSSVDGVVVDRGDEVFYTTQGAGAFEGVPVVKVLLVASLAATFVCGGSKRKAGSPASVLAFSTLGETVVGTLLLYQLREVEKVKGSRKLATQFLFSLLLQVLCELVVSGSTDFFAEGFASGPYGAIFSLVSSSFFLLPSSSSFNFLGLELTSNIFTFVGSLHLLLLRGRSSFASGVCGLIWGFLYERNVLNIEKLQIPCLPRLIQITLRLLEGPDANKTKVRFGRYVSEQNRAEQNRREGRSDGSQVDNNIPVPSREALQTLESMGFEPALAAEALVATNNDINQAISLLT